MSVTTNGLGPYAETDRRVVDRPCYRRRCDRRRRRSSRFGHGDPPGSPWSCASRCWRRAGFPGEGLRRRAHTARHQAADPARHRHLRSGRLAAQQGLAHLWRRASLPAGVARSCRLPAYGLVRPRADFDQLLARHAVAAGASLYELSNVVEPIIDSAPSASSEVRTKDGRRFTAPMVVAADGNSTRLSLAMGLNRRDDRPMGVAVRTYYTQPATPRRLPGVLAGAVGRQTGQERLLPGYGWIFGMGDGTCNVGLGILNTSAAFGKTDYKDLLSAGSTTHRRSGASG